MSEIVDTNPVPTKDDSEFVCDMARFAEGLAGADEAALRKKWRLTNKDWEVLGADDDLVRAITDEKTRRVRTGLAKRERAQQHSLRVPDMAAGIAFDAAANPRHRLDAGALLDKLSANGPEAATIDSTRFIIRIDLSGDVLNFNRSIEINPNDVDPNDPNVITAIPTKPTEGGSDESI